MMYTSINGIGMRTQTLHSCLQNKENKWLNQIFFHPMKQRPALNVDGFIAQLVEHCTGNTTVMDSNPI